MLNFTNSTNLPKYKVPDFNFSTPMSETNRARKIKIRNFVRKLYKLPHTIEVFAFNFFFFVFVISCAAGRSLFICVSYCCLVFFELCDCVFKIGRASCRERV